MIRRGPDGARAPFHDGRGRRRCDRPDDRPARPGLGNEPVPGLHCRRGRHAVRHGLPEQRSRALDRGEPGQYEQRGRHLPAGPLVERRRAWARGRREPQRGNELHAGADTEGDRLLGRDAANGGNYQRATDPWVTFGPNGNLYQLSLSFNDVNPPFTAEDFDHALLASRSTNGGHTWSDPVVVRRDTAPSVFNDKQSITADPTNAGLVYAVWDRLVFPPGNPPSVVASFRSSAFRGPTWFARSTNGGLSWEPARQIYDPGQNDQTIGNQIVVQPNGTLVDVLTEFNNENTNKLRGATFRVLRSTDKGASWSGPFLVDRLETISITDPDTGAPIRTGEIIPDIGVNRANGRLYHLAGRAVQRWPERQHRVLTVPRRWAHVVGADQGQPDADRDPIGEPAGVHAVGRGCERRHDRSHVLRLPQQHGRSEQPANRLLRRPLPPDDGDGMHEPPQLGERGPPPTTLDARRALRGRHLHGRLRGTRGDRRLPGVLLAPHGTDPSSAFFRRVGP